MLPAQAISHVAEPHVLSRRATPPQQAVTHPGPAPTFASNGSGQSRPIACRCRLHSPTASLETLANWALAEGSDSLQSMLACERRPAWVLRALARLEPV
jgi:hypothetical protein